MTARERLRAWIEEHTNQRRFAADINIHETYLSQVLSGRRTPRLPILGAIERETGIPLNSWLPTSHGEPSGAAKKPKRNRYHGREKSRVA